MKFIIYMYLCVRVCVYVCVCTDRSRCHTLYRYIGIIHILIHSNIHTHIYVYNIHIYTDSFIYIYIYNNQYYKVRIKGKVEQSRERNTALHLGEVAIEKGAFGLPSAPSPTLLTFIYI